MCRQWGETYHLAVLPYLFGLARVEPEDNTLVAFAAAAGSTADDGAGNEHSPFTAALLKHLRTPALDIRLLLGKIRDEVVSATGRRQQPYHSGTLGGDEGTGVIGLLDRVSKPGVQETWAERGSIHGFDPIYGPALSSRSIGGARSIVLQRKLL